MLKRKYLTKLVAIKTCRPYLFQMNCSADRPRFFSSNCSLQRIRVFLSINEPMLLKLVSHCCNSRCNQKMPVLPLSDDLLCWTTRTFSYNYFMQRIRVLLSANEPILHRLVSHRYNSLLTFSMMLSRWKWAFLEPQKVKMSKALKPKKRVRCSFILIQANLRQPCLLH